MVESDCYRDWNYSFKLYLAGFVAVKDNRQIDQSKGLETLGIARVRKENMINVDRGRSYGSRISCGREERA